MPIYPSNKSSKNSKRKKVQSRLGISLICIFSVLLICLVFNALPVVNTFLYGVIGLAIYPISLFLIVYGIMKIRRIDIKITKKEMLYLFLIFCCLVAMIHSIMSSSIINNSFLYYLKDTYKLTNGYTAGGALFSLIIYPIYNITHTAGVFVVFAILSILFLTLFIDSCYKRKQIRMMIEDNNEVMQSQEYEDVEEENIVPVMQTEMPYDDSMFIKDEEEPVSPNLDKSIARKILGLEKEPEFIVDEEDEDLFEESYEEPVNTRRPQMVIHEDIEEDVFEDKEPLIDISRLNKTKEIQLNPEEKQRLEQKEKNRAYLEDIMGVPTKPNNSFAHKEPEQQPIKTNTQAAAKERLFGQSSNIFESQSVKENKKPNESKNADIYDEKLTLRSYEKNKTQYIDKLNNFDTASSKIAKANEVYTYKETNSRIDAKSFSNNIVNVNEINQITPKAEKKKIKRKPYVKPPIDLLEDYSNVVKQFEDNEEKSRRLEETLDNFRIPAKVCSVARGPSFTRFELTMPAGISVKKIDNLVPDMQMALASKGAIRTEIPIPGKNAFGIEIPNEIKDTVGLRDIIDSYEFQNSKYGTAYSLGKDISNSPIVGNIEKMPHLLVAGTTGSGKSVCLNSMLVSLLYKSGPEDLRLILIDPKRLEFSLYNGLPHLLVPKVITDKEKAMNAFDWLIDEMNRRINFYDSLKMGIRNIEEYNACEKVKSGELEKMPKIIVIVDELNELMMQTRKEMESKIVRIAQLSRAVGIHLVLATQRPSVDVITGLVKSNLPSRIAFAVASIDDSRTILNQGGAENLLGYGDMLYSPVGTNKPHRIQGSFVKNSEVEKVVEFVKANNDCIFDEELEEQMFNRNQDVAVPEGGGGASKADATDPLMKDVLRFAIKSGGISTTKVQRYLRIGYPRAAKIIDDMEALNYISKKDDKNNRVIFMTQQEFEEVFGEDF